MDNTLNPTTRFSSRVADYVKYRPDYPRGILTILRQKTGLSPDWVIADVGCGTGISCRMFLENGNTVFGVEPNDDMRTEAEREFTEVKGFRAIKGTAEATSLPEASVDMVVAAQAFHWFDRAGFAAECRRILRPSQGGYVALMWNTRLTGTNPFAAEYDQLLLSCGTDYKQVTHRTPTSPEQFQDVFSAPFERVALPNQQVFNFEELCGRVRSSSYTPQPGQAGYDELYAALRRLFDTRQQQGRVAFDYETELYIGRICKRESQI